MSKFLLFRNISIRLALLIVILLTLSLTAYIIFSKNFTTSALHTQAKNKAKSEITNEALEIEKYFTNVQKDLLFLSSLPQLNTLTRQNNDSIRNAVFKTKINNLRKDLGQVFAQFASSRKVFNKIRFIDSQGQELISISYQNESAFITKTSDLKNCKGDNYFVKARQLKQNQFYHTFPNLKKDNKGKALVPWQPVMRYATPVVDKASKHQGMIVADLNLDTILAQLKRWENNDNKHSNQSLKTTLSLADPQGNYIYNANNTILWGKDLNRKGVIKNYPQEVTLFLQSPEKEPIEVEGNIYAAGRISLVPHLKKSYLVLLYEIPSQRLDKVNSLVSDLSIIGLVFLLVVGTLIWIIARWSIVARLKVLRDNVEQLMRGNIPDIISTKSGDEIGQITQEINELTINISQMVNFADKVGTGDYSAKTKFKPDIVLGNTLIKMRDNLKLSTDEQKRNKWVSDGLARFSEVLRSQGKLSDVGNQVIISVVKYLNANQGALYMLSEDNEEELTLLAIYGIDQEVIKQRIKIDDGLAGQAFRQKEVIHMADAPADYGYIKSITGKSMPNNVLIVPLAVQENVEGVLEISSFKTIESHEIKLVTQLAEAIAITISSVKSNNTTKKLLKESQESEKKLQMREEELNKNMHQLIETQKEVENKTDQIEEQKKQIEKSLEDKTEQTEMLLAQEEEMRQNMEELQATQEAMSDKQRELEKAKKKLEVNEQVLKKAYKKARDRELEIKQKNEELKAQEEEIRQNMEELKATQEAMERKQVELEGVNKKLAANEKVLTMAYEQVKESEAEIRQKNEEITKQSNVLEEAKDELERKNKKMAANERVLKKAYEKIRSQEQGLKDTINQLQTTEEELRQNMEELQTTQEALQDKTRSLEIKNKLITNSINYAKNIQTAILPKKEEMEYAFSDYYVLYMPKDIVSGDFYWLRQVSDSTVYLAIVDCTGHGVPGALMSMIGSSLLNRTLSEHKILEPGKILENLHMGIRARLRQAEANSGDGMVVSLAQINRKPDNMFEITFAAAKQNIYYIEEDGEMKTIKGDRKSIGGWQRESYRTFSNQSITLKKGTKLYFTTDGILDNPNPRRKRFGEKYLKHIILENHNLPFETQKQILSERLAAHQQTADQRDDITVIGIQL